MSKSELQNWLFSNKGFQERYRHVVIDSVTNQFPALNRLPSGEKHDWSYLLLCASLLAQSADGNCQDVSLRIAQFCLQANNLQSEYKDAAAVILDILANQPAINLAEARNLIECGFEDRLPHNMLCEWIRRSLENVISLSDCRTLSVNHFQREFWGRTKQNNWISISAPTSSGKSFILGQWLADYIRSSPCATIVYLVPTRALIQQVQQDLERVVKSENIPLVAISTLPLLSAYKPGVANVFVFTQERFHILIGERGANLSVDLLIVDEAQKIGDNYRGVLLQQAIENTVHRNKNCRIVFASPMTDNPDVLLDDAPDGVISGDIVSEDTMVNQNLLWVSQITGKPKEWEVELILDGKSECIGQIALPSSPAPDSKRLPFVAFTLGSKDGGNVLYVNGSADAEKAAKQLYDLLGKDADISFDEEIDELVDLIKKTIHSQYSLSRVLLRGVAFHYGNIPLLVRTEIERLFCSNKIKYLVCTSTLIEGVNMPCQSIFARGPTKGRGVPMTPSDFWNLAGRAGRWGKEFQGNVICVDTKRNGVWKNGAPLRRSKFRITRTTDQVLSSIDALLEYIANGTPRDEAIMNPNLEYVFSYLMSCNIQNGSISNALWSRRFPEDVIQRINLLLAEISNTLSTPHDVILRNPGISPLAMDGLLGYFHERTEYRKMSVEELLPPPPESENAVNGYARILMRINKHLGDVFGREGRVFQLALLIVNWMKGYPLARIISSREKYYGNDNLAGLIRNTMKDVEEIARYQAPKYLACYVDLLRVYLERINKPDLINRLFELNVLLEFGVSQKTQLSLVGIGLSRSSAIALSELITDDSMSEETCLTWLHENDWMTHDMPALIKREIRTVLDRKKRSY
ncbi:DEAD/DEAH box helicase [Chlorobium ferrooxidans]|uniref:Helicase-like:DEAD/DEAH box helicase-like n=1 Tax=Chlorobium ferrooxidans DSM 13031 TaxID=377431 RepID=Q0YUH5_9CHLB|nr:DEAD/DEAH box helicase [Chlorobium ferrooxidans]EAT60056.1 Helicase-like:DEAD/DEAH box helicase-like [Chlorobium ferrooxidans DSM 13031]